MPPPSIEFGDHTGVLTDVLRYFIQILNEGGDRIVTAQSDACLVFLTLQFLKAAAEVGFSRRLAMGALGTLMGGLAWYSVAMNIVPLADSYIQWMGSLGTQVGAGGVGAVMNDPSMLLDVGFKTVKGMGKVTNDLNILTAAGILLLMCFTAVLVMLGFTVMGCIAVYVVVKSYVNVVVGVALIPFAVEPSTRFLAAPGIGLIMEAGISLGTTSVVLSVGHGVMQKLLAMQPPDEMTLRHGWNVFMASVLISVLSGGCAAMGKIAGVAVSGALKAQRLFG
ncbi:MAG TPA: type IV secretion system protein [Bryobacteraceae bacterium]|nr:type IV secretion system protein [Bryobacteraceae bacterium]